MAKIRGASHGLSVAGQDIYEESETQKHRLGERLPLGDRVFRYCKAGAALTTPSKGAFNYSKPYEGNRAATAYAVGATEITIPTTATGTGNNAESNSAADAYADGYIWFQTTIHQLHRIRKNTVSDGTNQVITLYDGLTTLLPTGTIATTRWVTMWLSPYADVRDYAGLTTPSETQRCSVVCVPLIQVTSGYYFWGQTWGPCMFTSFGTVPGTSVNTRLAYFANDGSLLDSAGRSTAYGRQIAGYLLHQTTSANGDQMIMLQLTP